MPGKSIPLSVRLTPEDATFLAELRISGATTPSDKLRALIQETRRRKVGVTNYQEALTIFEELLSDTLHRVREVEIAEGLHSELIVQLVGWLPDVMAYLTVRAAEVDVDDTAAKLRRLEAGLADRVIALIEQVLRLGVTSRNPCYDPSAITSRVGPVVELSELIRIGSSRSEAEQ